MIKKRKSFVSKNAKIHLFVLLLLIIPSILLMYTLLRSFFIFHQPTTPLLKTTVTIPTQGAFIGVSLYDQDYRSLVTLEKTLQKHFAIVGAYQSWGEKNNRFNKRWGNAIIAHNSIPLITWEPWVPITGYDRSDDLIYQEDYLLQNITDGKFDSYITRFAKDVKQFQHPIIIRFAHEMNGNWYPWASTFNTPEEYIASWRHVHTIFEQEGANNVIWLWAPNEIYYDERVPYTDKLLTFYPGDAYVDWVGFSSFNWAGKYKQNIWRSPQDLYAPTIEQLASLNKPIIIAETASAEGPGSTMKSQWIYDLASYIKSDTRIKGIIWFNIEDNGIDWKIESSNLSIEAHRQAFDSYFIYGIVP